jgi:hypothetical protein
VIENVSNELKKYFEGKPIMSSLLGLDMVLLLGLVVLDFIDIFIGLGFISALILYGMLAAILLCLANRNFNALMLGLGGKTLVEFIALLYWLIRGGIFSWSAFIAIIIYGFFAYQAFRKSSARP